jgi:L-asparaginase/Glu-tRNA(Gln) amidotransferase subunit D
MKNHWLALQPWRPLKKECFCVGFQIAKDIKNSYEMFDGFVVLHGTDTLAYTASALSFMLENLGKPVIVTG